MKKVIFYYSLFFLIFSTGCSSDDSTRNSYPTISEEEKALLLGSWQLMHYEDLEGNAADLRTEGILIYYHFLSHGRLTIENVSSKLLSFSPISASLMLSEEWNFLYSCVEFDDKKERNGEKLDFLTPGFIFDMKVTQEKLVLTKYSGETLQFKRSTKMLDEVEYPAISVSDKKALNSTSWRLEKIQAFTGEHRSFDQGEHVIYSFGSDGVFVIKNATAVEDNTFERFLKPRTLSYSYRYDFALENREILYINDLGGYRILFTNDELRLEQNDGYLLTFTKA